MKTIKLLLVLIVSTIVFFSCSTETTEGIKPYNIIEINNYKLYVYVIDSCEYVGYISSFNGHANMISHKGNCKFCLERQKKSIHKIK